MPKITLGVDDEIIKQVRKIAVEQNTTLTAMVRELLQSVARRDKSERERALNRLESSFQALSRDFGPHGWTRGTISITALKTAP